MTPGERARALIELGDQMVTVCSSVPGAWQKTKDHLREPVAIDRFVLQAHTAADALMILAQRAQEFAGDLLDGED